MFIEHQFSTARVDSLETWTIKQVACGQMHTLAVTSKGLVFAWGGNTKGQLGLGSSDTTSHKHPRCIVNHLPKQLKYLEGVGSVWSWVCEVCCGTHGILLKESPLPCPNLPGSYIFVNNSGLEIATDTVANATNIFSLATKNSTLVAKVATRFPYALDLN